MQEAGGRMQEAGGRRQETGGRMQEAGAEFYHESTRIFANESYSWTFVKIGGLLLRS